MNQSKQFTFSDIKLGLSLAERNISAKYRQNFASYLWAFVPPLLVTGAFLFANKVSLINVESGKVPYPLFAFLGSTLWTLTADCLDGPTQALNGSKSFLSKVRFNRVAIVIAQMCEILVQFFLRLSLVAALLIYYKFEVSVAGVLVGILSCFALMLTATSLGMILGPIHMLFSDLYNIFKIVLSYGMFLVPAVYQIPNKNIWGKILNNNPLAFLIVAGRDSILIGPAYSILAIGLLLGLAMVFFVLGFFVFRKSIPHIIDRMI